MMGMYLFAAVTVSALISGVLVVWTMNRSLSRAYVDIFGTALAESWQRIINVVIMVSSLSGGISFYSLERYLFAVNDKESVRAITADSIAFESLKALLGGAQAVVHILLALLIVSVLVALLLKIKGVLNTPSE